MNKIEQLADKLRETWNITTQQMGVRWECLNERSRRGYIAVAEKAIEELSEKQYRMLEVGEVLQATDEVQIGPEKWQLLGTHWVGEKVTDKPRFPVGFYRRPLPTREDADKVIKHLSEVREDQAFQIRSLEQKLEAQTKAKDSWMRDATKAMQEQAKWEEACHARDKYIDKLVKERDALKAEQVVSMWHGAGDPRLKVLIEKMDRIEKATMRLRGHKEINSHDPAQCIEDAASLIQRLQHKVRQLEDEKPTGDYQKAWTIASRAVTELTERCEKLTCQLQTDRYLLNEAVDGWNKDHMEMKRRVDEHYKECLNWREKFSKIGGVVGGPGLIGNADDVIALTEEMKRKLDDKNATIRRLTEKLENVARYINALEDDLSFYNTVADMFKTKLESAAHGE